METPNYNKAELYLIGYLADKGQKIRGGEVRDFSLFGDETEEEIEEYANDYLSDLASEEAEYRAERKMNQYDTPSLDMELQY